jgi:hypothetical protein
MVLSILNACHSGRDYSAVFARFSSRARNADNRRARADENFLHGIKGTDVFIPHNIICSCLLKANHLAVKHFISPSNECKLSEHAPAAVCEEQIINQQK